MVPNSLSSKGFFLPPSKMLHTPPPTECRADAWLVWGVGHQRGGTRPGGETKGWGGVQDAHPWTPGSWKN